MGSSREGVRGVGWGFLLSCLVKEVIELGLVTGQEPSGEIDAGEGANGHRHGLAREYPVKPFGWPDGDVW